MKTLNNHLHKISGKRVIVRANFDVPLEEGSVVDDTRILDCIPTLKLLLDQSCQLVIIAHQDRPQGSYSQENSLQPVAKILENTLHHPVNFVAYQKNPQNLKVNPDYGINLLDNLRFWPGETDNHLDFAKSLSTLADIYINEAFANCHRQHASITSLPQILPGYAGLLLDREIQVLNQVSQSPSRPLVIVIGGAKIDTKKPLVNAFSQEADKILVGGKIAGDMAKLPQNNPNVIIADLNPDGKDITVKSAHKFSDIISSAGTVIWNGTMGMFEDENHQQGTKIVATAINTASAFTLVGGGDTEAALSALDSEANINHICSGGGAMLTYLCTGSLVGLRPLQ